MLRWASGPLLCFVKKREAAFVYSWHVSHHLNCQSSFLFRASYDVERAKPFEVNSNSNDHQVPMQMTLPKWQDPPELLLPVHRTGIAEGTVSTLFKD